MYTNGNKILSQLIFTVFYLDTGNFKALLVCKTETKIILNTNLCTQVNRYETPPPKFISLSRNILGPVPSAAISKNRILQIRGLPYVV